MAGLGRRQLLAAGAGLGLALDEALAEAARQGFDIQGTAESLRALGLAAPQPSRELELIAPDIAEDGAQVRIELVCKAAGLRRLWLLAERNPAALLASLSWSEWLEPRLVTQVKLAQSGRVTGVVQLADGRLLIVHKDVKVTLGGCGA